MVSLDVEGAPFFVATEYAPDGLRGLRWDGEAYRQPQFVPFTEVGTYQLNVTHYYGLAEIRFSSLLELAFHRLTRLEYGKIRIKRWLEATDQYFFNKKKLVTKKRMELLEFMVNDQLDREHDGIGRIDLMTKLYSIKWVLHPAASEQQSKLCLYLDSLVESRELKKINSEYVVTGKAIGTLERYEEEERRHTEAVKLQKKMVSLTVIVAFMAMVQSGLIQMPPLIDFTTWGDATEAVEE